MPQPKKLPYVHLSIGPADDLSESSKEKVRHSEAKRSASKKRRRTTDSSSGSYGTSDASSSIPILGSDSSSEGSSDHLGMHGMPSSFAQTYPYGPSQISMPGVYPAFYGAPMVIPSMPGAYQAPMYFTGAMPPQFAAAYAQHPESDEDQAEEARAEPAASDAEDAEPKKVGPAPRPDPYAGAREQAAAALVGGTSSDAMNDAAKTPVPRQGDANDGQVDAAQIRQLQAQAYQAGRAAALEQAMKGQLAKEPTREPSEALDDAMAMGARSQEPLGQRRGGTPQQRTAAAFQQPTASQATPLQPKPSPEPTSAIQAQPATAAHPNKNPINSQAQPAAAIQAAQPSPQQSAAVGPHSQQGPLLQQAQGAVQPSQQKLQPLPNAQQTEQQAKGAINQQVSQGMHPIQAARDARRGSGAPQASEQVRAPQQQGRQLGAQQPFGQPNAQHPMMSQAAVRQPGVDQPTPQKAGAQQPANQQATQLPATQQGMQPGRDEQMWVGPNGKPNPDSNSQSKGKSAEDPKRTGAAKKGAMEESRRRNAEGARRREREEQRRRKADEVRRHKEQESARRTFSMMRRGRAANPDPKKQPIAADARKAAGKAPFDPRGLVNGAFSNPRAQAAREGVVGASYDHGRKRITTVICVIAGIVVTVLAFLLIFTMISSEDAGNGGTPTSTTTSQGTSPGTSSNSGSSSSQGGSSEVIYEYVAATSAGVPYTVVETVTFGSDGKCQSSTLDMTFPDAESAKAFTESLARGQGSSFQLDLLDGDHAIVTIDNSTLKLDSTQYENALRYSVTDLVVNQG